MRNAFIEKLSRMAESDPRIFLITGDLGFGVLDQFAKDFPRQFLNAGVAEQNMTGIATGLALEGRVVFTYSIANFPILRCLEQIRNDACYHEANVKVVSIGGGFSYGALGFSHHATEDLAVLRSLPGMMVMTPGDDWEAEEAVGALVTTPGVGYLRLDKSTAGHTQRSGEAFTLGQMRILREGTEITLISCGGILIEALTVADRLAEQGIFCRVMSCHTLKPFDRAGLLQAVSETGGIVTLEEHTVEGGLGSVVAETCLEAGIVPRLFYRIGIRDGFSALVGSQNYLRKLYHMDAASIQETICRLLNHQPRVAVLTSLEGGVG